MTQWRKPVKQLHRIFWFFPQTFRSNLGKTGVFPSELGKISSEDQTLLRATALPACTHLAWPLFSPYYHLPLITSAQTLYLHPYFDYCTHICILKNVEQYMYFETVVAWMLCFSPMYNSLAKSVWQLKFTNESLRGCVCHNSCLQRHH